ncbi:hypothetical protein VOLCADRAFT_108130 [Volvox carteri f. nagariensis]|uniref:Serine-threonine/tyrosine-protein kinase catalytic domain-containing protein n=1 Tax=Volvox carteri f. nagariensis TaxID=3068 RepID=D8UIG1_VOLCA|nr:uncharacterized protein VOLCADRAFT_108130 [Volvox carteri f. nagariensis]EFJ40469.1 hypothetical protein VOLCADRAFT_108130 [Volvox carteri f. nagariensis]|eukprot:XP_002958469.1 hypothetical protein VOLCADRAFT_108130 [Volvox carteri f. nagariensis]
MAKSGEQSLLELDPKQARKAKISWNSGLCDLCDVPGTCCFGLLCLPCLFGRNYGRFHNMGCWGPCCLYFWCPCLACYFATDLRRNIREKYNLRPEPCNDFMVHCLCSPCALCQESAGGSKHAPGTSEPPPQVDSGRLQELQLALGALEGDGFEARAAHLASTVQEHLGPAAIVRCFILFSSRPALDRALHGRGSGRQSYSILSSAVSLSADRSDTPLLLLEQAMSSKAPSGALSLLPRDCAAELAFGQVYGASPTVFAALPLTYGKRVLGALWMAVPHHAPSFPTAAAETAKGVAQSAIGNKEGGSSHNYRANGSSTLLLANGPALEQLAMSASMALALAASGDVEYVSWLSGCVRRLASCTTLHALVAGVCSALSKHVRQRFHADVMVQSALVPEPYSTLAFMLCPETKPAVHSSGGPHGLGLWLGGQGLVFPKPSAIPSGGRDPANELCRDGSSGLAQRPKYGWESVVNRLSVVMTKSSHKPVRRVSSQATLQPSEGCTTTASDKQPSATATMAHVAGSPRATAADCTAAGFASRGGALGRCSSVSPTSTVSAPVLCMSAKAFQLSHTLLSRLVCNARAQSPLVQVPRGIVVADTARHVADVRQPSRDVCMLIGAKGSMAAGSMWPHGGGGGGGAGSLGNGFADHSGSRSGPGSLLLLAMEVADGGCMLGLYVAFPNLMPMPLLTAARDSCEQLVRQMLVALVRHKLQTPELAPELDTLRAGVPGSYISIREHVDHLQLPLASFTPLRPPPPAATAVAMERLGLQPSTYSPQNPPPPSSPPLPPHLELDTGQLQLERRSLVAVTELGGPRAVEGLEELHLAEVLGHGASGVVLSGMLGTVPVAVKLMEMLDADYDAISTEAFAVYDNVIMARTPAAVDSFVLRRLDPQNPDTGGSPICTAIVQELCDCGSLADVLADRSFPALLPTLNNNNHNHNHHRGLGGVVGGMRAGGGGGGGVGGVERSAGSRCEIDMKDKMVQTKEEDCSKAASPGGDARIDSSVDIYALGIIFWELVCGRGHRPFKHLDPGAIPAAVRAGMRPIFTADVAAPYRKMAQACWAQEPHRRPRAAEVVSFIKAQLAALGVTATQCPYKCGGDPPKWGIYGPFINVNVTVSQLALKRPLKMLMERVFVGDMCAVLCTTITIPLLERQMHTLLNAFSRDQTLHRMGNMRYKFQDTPLTAGIEDFVQTLSNSNSNRSRVAQRSTSSTKSHSMYMNLLTQ